VKTLYICALTRKAPPINAISPVDVLEGKINRENFAGKIVILGCEGHKAPMFGTSTGKFCARCAFMANLLVLEQGGK
jgi:CHASE2 domain-containing sensor protein